MPRPSWYKKPESPKTETPSTVRYNKGPAYVCVACSDTGKNSRGGLCRPCLALGRIKVK